MNRPIHPGNLAPYLALMVFTAAIVLLTLPVGAYFQCADGCDPIYAGGAAPHTYRISYDQGVQATAQQKEDVANFIAVAAGNWNYEFQRRGFNASATHDAGSNDIEIVIKADLSGTDAHYDAATKKMTISKDYVNQFVWGFKIAVVMHEFGHAFGFLGSNCAGASVMSPVSPTSYQTYFTGCDQNAMSSLFGSPGEPDYCANGGCTPGYAPMGTPGCSEASIDECGCCLTYSPIILDLSADGVEFSSVEEGTVFTINDRRKRLRLGWPRRTDDAWLWLDRNENGFLDHGGELFGNATRLSTGFAAPDGFVALAELDSNGDLLIDAADASFQALRVWRDGNRDGYSQADEIATLESTNVSAIELTPIESRRTDRHGNVFKYRAALRLDGVKRRAWAWDVYPAVAPVAGESLVSCAIPASPSVSSIRP